MLAENLVEPLKIGSHVKILNSGYGHAKVAENLGPLGPKGARIYRVLVQNKPRRVYIEVREDQLEVLDCVSERGKGVSGEKVPATVVDIPKPNPVI
jgi:hypothetical protein